MGAVTVRVAVLSSLVAAAVGVGGGYLLRAQQSTVTVRVGQGHSTPYQIGLNTRGWSYEVPLNATWRDSHGGWHFDSRPDCLPPTGEISGVRFGSVEVRGGGGPSTRQVVWIDCG